YVGHRTRGVDGGADRGERVLDLVADVGGEALIGVDAVGERAGHSFERVRQRADFVLAPRFRKMETRRARGTEPVGGGGGKGAGRGRGGGGGGGERGRRGGEPPGGRRGGERKPTGGALTARGTTDRLGESRRPPPAAFWGVPGVAPPCPRRTGSVTETTRSPRS